MPDSNVILAVSQTLVTMINSATSTMFPAQTVAALDELGDPTEVPTSLLTVFLFEIMEDPASRNQPLVRQTNKTTVVVKLPPMTLQLNYLITAWSDQVNTNQMLIGRVLQLFYENAILSGPQLQGVLAGGTDTLKVTLHPLVLEDRTRIWHALLRPYRLSLSYGVRVVNLDATPSTTVAPITNGRLVSNLNRGDGS